MNTVMQRRGRFAVINSIGQIEFTYTLTGAFELAKNFRDAGYTVRIEAKNASGQWRPIKTFVGFF